MKLKELVEKQKSETFIMLNDMKKPRGAFNNIFWNSFTVKDFDPRNHKFANSEVISYKWEDNYTADLGSSRSLIVVIKG